MNKVFLLIGKDRAGKTSTAEVLKNDGYLIFECGQVVRNKYDEYRKKLPHFNFSVSSFYERFMTELNFEIMERFLATLATATEKSKIAIVGVRSSSLFSLFKDLYPSLKVILLLTNDEIRYTRYLVSNKDENILTYRDFLRRDVQQIKWGLGNLMELANITIDNDGSWADSLGKILEIK